MWLRTSDRSDLRTHSLLLAAVIGALSHSVWPYEARAQARPPAPPPSKSAAAGPDARGKDRASIRAVMDSFVKAFESRDAKALSAHWTALGEYRNQDDVNVQGREALEKGFAKFFAKAPEVQAQVEPESLRFVATNSAIEEGIVTVRRGAAEAANRAHYTALFVREDGQWRLAQLTESAADVDAVGDLAWLIGEWKSLSGEGAEIHTTYSWDANKKFIQVRFAVKEKVAAYSGIQVIGLDPATGGLRSWTFEATGGVAEADWERDGDHWVLEMTGTLVDGRKLTQTNILRRINEDTFTWQSVERKLDDADVPDLPPVKVTRVKPAK